MSLERDANRGYRCAQVIISLEWLVERLLKGTNDTIIEKDLQLDRLVLQDSIHIAEPGTTYLLVDILI